MEPTFFKDAKALRQWFMRNHKTAEMLLGYYKVGTGKPSVTWPESVDEALCFGWIDGVRRSIDADSYTIRFTPRKATSIWSAINIAKVEQLVKDGKMQPEGMAAFEKRKEHKSAIYSYESEPKVLSAEYERAFKANKAAWAYFRAMAPSYQRTAIHWVMSAKQEATRLKRIDTLIADSAAERKIKPLSYDGRK